MNKDTDQSDDEASKQDAESSLLPLQRPRRSHGRKDRQRANRTAACPREGLALARHRNGTHRKLKQTVICEIPDRLSVSTTEFEVLAVILREKFNRIFDED